MKYIKRKFITTKGDLAGNIVDTINIVDRASNAPSLNLVLELIYPVGSYYWSSVNKSPQDLFNFGTWERVKDKFVLAAGDSYTSGSTGGATTHTHTVPGVSHNHSLSSGYALIGRDSSTYMNIVWKVSGFSFTGDRNMATAKSVSGSSTAGIDAAKLGGSSGSTTPNSATSDSASNMPPYEVAYCWKRVADTVSANSRVYTYSECLTIVENYIHGYNPNYRVERGVEPGGPILGGNNDEPDIYYFIIEDENGNKLSGQNSTDDISIDMGGFNAYVDRTTLKLTSYVGDIALGLALVKQDYPSEDTLTYTGICTDYDEYIGWLMYAINNGNQGWATVNVETKETGRIK